MSTRAQHEQWEERLKIVHSLFTDANSPIVLELAGLPITGKSTFADSFSKLLIRCGFTTTIINERAVECPIKDRWSAEFTAWGIATYAGRLLELQSKGVQVIIGDRGLFDARAWLTLKFELKKCSGERYFALKSLTDPTVWTDARHIVAVFLSPIDDVLSRSSERALTAEGSLVTRRDYMTRLHQILDEQAAEATKKEELIVVMSSHDQTFRQTLENAAESVITLLEDISTPKSNRMPGHQQQIADIKHPT